MKTFYRIGKRPGGSQCAIFRVETTRGDQFLGTQTRPSESARSQLEEQTISVELMTLEDLEATPMDWSQSLPNKPDQLRKLPQKDPRPHQNETLTNDSKTSRNEEDMRIYELAYPTTTNANKRATSLSDTKDENAATVIFSTYQSTEVVHQTQQKTGIVFDLAVCDEAHRTAGYTAPGGDHSAFVRVYSSDAGRAELLQHLNISDPDACVTLTRQPPQNTGQFKQPADPTEENNGH